jgi:bifunctional DNA primase/polymerase-like protein
VSAAQARLERMLAWASAYVSFRSPAFPDGLPIFPVDAASRAPLTSHGVYDATTDFAVISAKLRNCPTADLALHVPAGALVVDLDEKNGKHGLADFKRFDGRDPTTIETPQASSPSGGLHLIFSASQAYANAVAIKGTGIDLRWRGGYVVLPGDGNGRRWGKRLSTTPIAPAPAWLADMARPKAPPAFPIMPSAFTTGSAKSALRRAVMRILVAPEGVQENTRHRQCFWIGTLIASGALDYATAYSALVAAAQSMTAHGTPWRDLAAKVEVSIKRGMQLGGLQP